MIQNMLNYLSVLGYICSAWNIVLQTVTIIKQQQQSGSQAIWVNSEHVISGSLSSFQTHNGFAHDTKCHLTCFMSAHKYWVMMTGIRLFQWISLIIYWFTLDWLSRFPVSRHMTHAACKIMQLADIWLSHFLVCLLFTQVTSCLFTLL